MKEKHHSTTSTANQEHESFRSRVLKDRLLFLGVVVFLGVAFFLSVTVQRVFLESIEIIELFVERHLFWGAVIFVLLAAFSAMFSLFSSVPLVPIATVVFGNFFTGLLLCVGWLLGDMAAYAIGSSAGYRIVSRFISMDRAEYYKKRLSGRSQFWIVFIFRFALPSEVTGYTLGVLRYHFGKYALATALSEIPFAFLAVYSSEALIQRRLALFLGLITAGVLVTVLMLALLKKQLNNDGRKKGA